MLLRILIENVCKVQRAHMTFTIILVTRFFDMTRNEPDTIKYYLYTLRANMLQVQSLDADWSKILIEFCTCDLTRLVFRAHCTFWMKYHMFRFVLYLAWKVKNKLVVQTLLCKLLLSIIWVKYS